MVWEWAYFLSVCFALISEIAEPILTGRLLAACNILEKELGLHAKKGMMWCLTSLTLANLRAIASLAILCYVPA